jgi:hypothetical protein
MISNFRTNTQIQQTIDRVRNEISAIDRGQADVRMPAWPG